MRLAATLMTVAACALVGCGGNGGPTTNGTQEGTNVPRQAVYHLPARLDYARLRLHRAGYRVQVIEARDQPLDAMPGFEGGLRVEVAAGHFLTILSYRSSKNAKRAVDPTLGGTLIGRPKVTQVDICGRDVYFGRGSLVEKRRSAVSAALRIAKLFQLDCGGTFQTVIE